MVAVGDTRPVGARASLRGRDKIIMTEWGPWDHESPLLQARRAVPGERARVFDLLVYLIRQRERVIDKDELLDEVWPGVVVSESTLTQAVRRVRSLVRDTGAEQDPLARFDAGFVLLSGTVRNLLADLKKALGGYA